MEDVIAVFDHVMVTGEKCKCGKDVTFTLVVYGNVNYLCESCLANIGKKIIDGLT